ncbi:hypothetical protein GCM10023189_51350 [Nibrella saemangeumensis]|uniref:Enamine deaminase RidA, house cleaning of reactive enamine intermediates, YjgF/YER057c/UK114 family n=1 Tax=Nibrella saemangeumensis TaxID=1084526 RepID=A0ABP8NJR3_9BACT
MNSLLKLVSIAFAGLTLSNCQPGEAGTNYQDPTLGEAEYFTLRPDLEEPAGLTQAVRIGNTIRVSGAVSIDDQGNPTSVGDMKSQLKNVYSDLEKTLRHFDCTFDDVVVETVYTTNMDLFKEHADLRASYYKRRYPTGSWLEVKQLDQPEFLVEIELEAEKKYK